MSFLYILCLLTSFGMSHQFGEHPEEEEGIVIEMPASYWTSEEMFMGHHEIPHHLQDETNNDDNDGFNEDHQEDHQADKDEETNEEEIMMHQESKEFFHQYPAQIFLQYDCKYYCNIRGDGVWPLFPCSPKFCACANNIAYTQSCPEILIFDVRYLICNWRFNVPFCN